MIPSPYAHSCSTGGHFMAGVETRGSNFNLKVSNGEDHGGP